MQNGQLTNDFKFNIGSALNVPANTDKLDKESMKDYFFVKRGKGELSNDCGMVIDAICRLKKTINISIGEAKLKTLFDLFIGMSRKLALLDNDYIDCRNKESFILFKKIAEVNFEDHHDLDLDSIKFFKGGAESTIENEINVEKNLDILFDKIEKLKGNHGEFTVTDETIAEVMAYSFILKHRTSQQDFVRVLMGTVDLVVSADQTGLKLIKDDEFRNVIYGLSQAKNNVTIPYV